MIKSLTVQPINFISSILLPVITAGVLIYCVLPPYNFLYDLFHNPSTTQEILGIVFFFIGLGIFWTLGIIFPIYVVYNHYQYDKTTIITIDDRTGEITYSRKGKSLKFNRNDIERYTHVYSQLNSISESYKIIWLKNGEKIIITSFLSEHLRKYLKKIPWKSRGMRLPLLDIKNDPPKCPYYL